MIFYTYIELKKLYYMILILVHFLDLGAASMNDWCPTFETARSFDHHYTVPEYRTPVSQLSGAISQKNEDRMANRHRP
jgi:hypothetical protein